MKCRRQSHTQYATVSYISLDLLYIHNGDEPSENLLLPIFLLALISGKYILLQINVVFLTRREGVAHLAQ